MKKYKHIHFIGIGGIGMSGIARILLMQGYKVSGSDLKRSRIIKSLESLGAKIHIEHKKSNIRGADVVVISSAIPEHNPEILAAREHGIPVLQRAEMLSYLMETSFGIAIAGTHGKTTTTSMIGSILEKLNLDPTVVVGGELDDFGSNARLGGARYFVAEADESDASLINLKPKMVVVTNIDVDINLNIDVFKNLNYNYKKVLTKVKEIFKTFIERLPSDGVAVLCHDDANVRSLLPSLRRNYLTYGIDTEAQLKASNINFCGFTSSFIVELNGKLLGEVHLNVPGKHNILNALAAIGVSLSLGLDFEAVARALGKFEGVSRRFNILGEVSGIMVVDDYAHNPAKIKATLSAVRTGERKRTIAIFQPHRYTRTKFLMDDYLQSFKDADVLIVTPIYSAGESVIEGITSEILVNRLKSSLAGKPIHYFAQEKDIMDYVLGMAQPGDLFLTMGAGDINLFASQLIKQLKQSCTSKEALACTS